MSSVFNLFYLLPFDFILYTTDTRCSQFDFCLKSVSKEKNLVTGPQDFVVVVEGSERRSVYQCY